jgi:hypothetical protein
MPAPRMVMPDVVWEHALLVIASEAKQSRGHSVEDWIASSLSLLAMTV